jgi:hypothetical protein
MKINIRTTKTMVNSVLYSIVSLLCEAEGAHSCEHNLTYAMLLGFYFKLI